MTWNFFSKYTYKNFHVAAVIEGRITRNTSKLCNTSLTNNVVLSTPVESSGGGALLYTSCQLSDKSCSNDIKLNKNVWIRINFQIRKVKCHCWHDNIEISSMDISYFSKREAINRNKNTYFFSVILISFSKFKWSKI